MPNIQLLFGPMLIGVFMNMILYGVLIMQTLTYYQTYKHDAPWIRYLVLYLFLIETLNTGIDISIMYQPLILEYGLPKATTFFPTMFPFQPISVVAVSTPIQLFFAWRIWLLTRSPWVPILIALFAVTSLAGGIWTATMVAILQLFSKKPQLHVPALVWFLAACAADVLITINLVLTLTKKKTGFVATDDAISKIIRMTVQTGMLTYVSRVTLQLQPSSR
ncbi:hypothetical protein BDN72DRAFT_616836 [Pluteus cervinus]|uniref:Uncharacterized protein n=1 Tax=Pluteus cervinus TaxID=181527 RepID=A0ACD3AVJ0_9AGAR|nr:hypothetical protein BDN72DRAFT_616836 [Pluteus cervinus]